MERITVKIGGYDALFTSEKYSYKISAFNREFDDKDLIGMYITEVDDNLEKIVIEIGASEIITISKEKLKILKGKNILENIICEEPYVIPLSKAYYYPKDIIFYYNKKYLEENEKFCLKEKIKKIPILEECVIYNERTKEVENGKRVIDWKTENDGTEKNIIEGVKVKIPEITLIYTNKICEKKEFEIIEDIKINSEDMTKIEVINMLKKHDFHEIGGSIANIIKDGYFYVSVKNTLMFNDGMAGKKYIFNDGKAKKEYIFK